jgi:hypothetical protein
LTSAPTVDAARGYAASDARYRRVARQIEPQSMECQEVDDILGEEGRLAIMCRLEQRHVGQPAQSRFVMDSDGAVTRQTCSIIYYHERMPEATFEGSRTATCRVRASTGLIEASTSGRAPSVRAPGSSTSIP